MSRYSFNLATERWVPCMMKDGTSAELSLIQIFSDSNDIIDIIDPNPLVKVSVTRLLLAIVHRCIPTMGFVDLDRIWNQNEWASEKMIDYLDQWKGRFDLFDMHRPFFQISGYAGEPTTISKLAFEMASGNNPTLFDHSMDECPKSVTPSTAARLLLYNQTFNLSAGKSMTGHTKDAPLSRCALVIIKGRNLTETLKLNLVPYDPSRPLMSLGSNIGRPSGSDLPLWERDDEVAGTNRYAKGYLDLLTWPSRCIRLVPEESGGRLFVSKAYFSQGLHLLDDNIHDPMVPYILNQEDNSTYGMRLSNEKAVWRNLDSLLMTGNKSSTSYNVTNLHELVQNGIISTGVIGDNIDLFVAGLISPGQAKIDNWVCSTIPIPYKMLKEKNIREMALKGLDVANGAARTLRSSSFIFASEVIKKGREGKADPQRVNDFLKSSNVIQDYWASMEIPYLQLLNDLSSTDDPRETVNNWAVERVRRISQCSLDRLIDMNSNDVTGFRAAVIARKHFFKNLGIGKETRVGDTSEIGIG